jgi:hypothetical protein
MLCGIGFRFNLLGGDVFGRVSDKGSSEDWEQPVGFQTAEALGRFHHAGRRPAEGHGGISPSLRLCDEFIRLQDRLAADDHYVVHIAMHLPKMESALENRSENNLTMTWRVYWLVGSVELGKKFIATPHAADRRWRRAVLIEIVRP